MPLTKHQIANSVVRSVEDAAALYGVFHMRLQSGAIPITGLNGKIKRVIHSGRWIDRFGEVKTAGMADLLLLPEVPQVGIMPLFVECKSGKAVLSAEQAYFRRDMQARGFEYLTAHNSADAVLEWFQTNGVGRRTWAVGSGQ